MSAEQWSPRDEKNPFRVDTYKTNEEWLEITRWYPFSIRALVVLATGDAKWHEDARVPTWDNAKEVMRALHKVHGYTLVVMKCERRGKEGRERPVLWSPSMGEVLSKLRDLGMMKGGVHDQTILH